MNTIDENSNIEEIIQALSEAGYRAHESTAGDGTKIVILPILDGRYNPVIVAAQDPELRAYFKNIENIISPDTYLHIVIRGFLGFNEVGVLWRRGDSGEIEGSDEWQQASGVQEVIKVVDALWAGRDALLNKYIGAHSG